MSELKLEFSIMFNKIFFTKYTFHKYYQEMSLHTHTACERLSNCNFYNS